MRFGDESDLCVKEKDDSFKGNIGNIYQSFGGQDICPTLEEKAAHLLYFIPKIIVFLTEINVLQQPDGRIFIMAPPQINNSNIIVIFYLLYRQMFTA